MPTAKDDGLSQALEDMIRRIADAAHTMTSAADIEQAGLVFADTIGVIAAGHRAPEMIGLCQEPELQLADRPRPGAAARVIASRLPYGSTATAAWLNGTAGTFLELDEGYRPTGHPAIHVVPAALATAESNRSAGDELAAAILAGYEVAARCFEAFRLPAAMHPHGHLGCLGAATAVAMLQGADPVAVAAIAATQALLTGWEACFVGATSRNTWSGHSNRAAVQACTMERVGFTGATASLAEVLHPHLHAMDPIQEPVVPGGWRIHRNYFKFHSACALTHAAIEATQAAWRDCGWTEPSEIDRIEVVTVEANVRVARQPEPNSLSTRFSIPYAVAAVLLNGASDPLAFQWDPDIAEFASRVSVASSPTLDGRWPDAAPARVSLHSRWRVVHATVDNPSGHHSRRPLPTDLRRKFVDLTSQQEGSAFGDAERYGQIFEQLARLGEAHDCSGLPLPT